MMIQVVTFFVCVVLIAKGIHSITKGRKHHGK